MITHSYTSEELRSLIARAETLLGQNLDNLIQKHVNSRGLPTPQQNSHRLIEQLLLLRHAAANPDDALAVGIAAVAGAEVGGILDVFEEWRNDPVWPEFQRALNSPEEYLHAVTTLSVASALRLHHPGTQLVASGGPTQSADLRMVVTDEHSLAVEVKTSPDFGSRGRGMTQSEAFVAIERALRKASKGFDGQLKDGHPCVLVIGGFNIDSETFNALGNAAGAVLAKRPERRNLLAIVVSDISIVAKQEAGRPTVELAHKTRIRSNDRYSGPLRFVGEWAGEWHLVKAPTTAS